MEARHVRLEAVPAVAPDAPISPEVRQLLDSALTIVRTHSVWRDTVTWGVVGPELYRRSAGAMRSADVYSAVRGLLARLGDRHSFLLPPSASRRFALGGAQNRLADVRRLAGGAIGYVLVPSFTGTDAAAAQAFALRTRAAIRAVIDSGACGWLVDLRQNTGGNMWPMLAGLEPLLGDGPVGAFASPGDEYAEWTVGGPLPPRFKPPSLASPSSATERADSIPVAVLTGPSTASAGEAVAVAFRGRRHARSFGRKTSGVPSGNRSFPLPDGSMLVVTVAIDMDRTGRRYEHSLEPDETLPPGAGEGPADATLKAATAWLSRQRACAANHL